MGDILRIYTDIDEEVEFLEENYMGDEAKWHRKKRRAYNLQKVGYIPLEETEHSRSESVSSIDSYEERRGFEGQNMDSHWAQARDAAQLGFIPVNEEEEYDAAASKMLRENQQENIKQRRKERSERESSISSKISSIFRSDKPKKKKKKKKEEKKRRRSSKLSQLLSFGSKKDLINDDIGDEEVESERKKIRKQNKNNIVTMNKM